MAKHYPQQVSYMRKDQHFLADGVWYISTPCPALAAGFPCCAAEGKVVDKEAGLIDEEVTWEEAKTPHHAGLIADRRHYPCAQAMDEEIIKQVRAMEIFHAEELHKTQHRNLDMVRKYVAELEASGASGELHERALQEARALLLKHEEGLKHSEQRVKDTRAANS